MELSVHQRLKTVCFHRAGRVHPGQNRCTTCTTKSVKLSVKLTKSDKLKIMHFKSLMFLRKTIIISCFSKVLWLHLCDFISMFESRLALVILSSASVFHCLFVCVCVCLVLGSVVFLHIWYSSWIIMFCQFLAISKSLYMVLVYSLSAFSSLLMFLLSPEIRLIGKISLQLLCRVHLFCHSKYPPVCFWYVLYLFCFTI